MMSLVHVLDVYVYTCTHVTVHCHVFHRVREGVERVTVSC